MTLTQLLTNLHQTGIHISHDQTTNAIHVRPASHLTPELRHAIIQHRNELHTVIALELARRHGLLDQAVELPS